MIDRQIPDVTFKTRVRDDSIGGPNAFHWLDMSVREEFVGKKAVVFPLPGESKAQASMQCTASRSTMRS